MTAYPYGYCGMPCALCTRNRGTGTSRCPGCSQDGYYTDVCKVHHCCRERALAHCGECADFPCARLGKMGDFRDLDTGGVKQKNCAFIAQKGFDAWYAEYVQRADGLTEALARYNNGRMKRWLCELFIKREPEELWELLRRAEGLPDDPKLAGKAFQQLVSAYNAEKAQAHKGSGAVLRLRELRDSDLPLLAQWLAAEHVAPWFGCPEDWLVEVRGRDGEYRWIRHFIAEYDGAPVGFGQYYEYRLGGEDWHGDLDLRGVYSLDYLIGEARNLRRGWGKQLLTALLGELAREPNARRVIARPDQGNIASEALLRACGFVYDEENALYACKLPGREQSV